MATFLYRSLLPNAERLRCVEFLTLDAEFKLLTQISTPLCALNCFYSRKDGSSDLRFTVKVPRGN